MQPCSVNVLTGCSVDVLAMLRGCASRLLRVLPALAGDTAWALRVKAVGPPDSPFVNNQEDRPRGLMGHVLGVSPFSPGAASRQHQII